MPISDERFEELRGLNARYKISLLAHEHIGLLTGYEKHLCAAEARVKELEAGIDRLRERADFYRETASANMTAENRMHKEQMAALREVRKDLGLPPAREPETRSTREAAEAVKENE